MSLEGKVALVTGAAQGIGKEIAMTLARAGADVAVADLNEAKVRETSTEIEGLGRKSLALAVNVAVYSAVEEAVNKILDKFQKLDILVNNAGITRDGLLVRMSDDDWDAVLDVNLKGTFNCLKAVSRQMMKQKSGKIVNMASIIGIMGNAGQINYAASKGGVIALTKSAAKELAARNINVNAVAPGFIKTPMTDVLSEENRKKMMELIPLKRFGEVQDVARVVLFLVSDASSYLTGQVIQVDGGMVM